MQTRLLIVDDQPLRRLGVKAALAAEGALVVVAEAAGISEAVWAMRRETPSLVLLAGLLEGCACADAIRQIRLARPDEARILVFAAAEHVPLVQMAFAGGAHGYLSRAAGPRHLVEALREVAAGGRYVCPSVGALLAEDAVRAKEEPRADPLSLREREVLRLIALGYTNQQAAALLNLSVRTIETHRAHILAKLDLRSRADIVAYALRHSLFESDPGPAAAVVTLARVPELSIETGYGRIRA